MNRVPNYKCELPSHRKLCILLLLFVVAGIYPIHTAVLEKYRGKQYAKHEWMHKREYDLQNDVFLGEDMKTADR